MSKPTIRIAMWSGPRNISTAMMRAWENRADCSVCDEPFYAYYLRETGVVHPGREEILAHQGNDWRAVVEQLTGPVADERPIFYQKQMAHHLLPGIGRDWLDAVTHAFLIREPRAMLASYLVKRDSITLEETGLPQQLEIFERVQRRSGLTPPVIDARDVLTDPRGVLTQLCHALEIEFSEQMLRWPAGPRASDGIWAKHWYDAVEASTGFHPYTPKPLTLAAQYEPLARECEAIYQVLHTHRLRPPGA